MAIREGRWHCPSCETEQLGRHPKCQACGAPKPAGTKHYLPEDAPEVTDPARLSEARAGTNKICRFCDSQVAAAADVCPNCGSPLDGEREQVRDYAPGSVPDTRFDADTLRDEEMFAKATTGSGWLAPDTLAAKPAAQPTRQRPRWLIPGVAGGTLASVTLGWFLFSTRPIAVTVESLAWERTIAIEDERTVREEDWSVPSGGRLVDSFRAIHHYDKVLDHYDHKTRRDCRQVQTGSEEYTCGSRDLGNGYFEDVKCSRPTYSEQCTDVPYDDPVYRDEPRYATKYRYDIERWFTNRTERAVGTGTEPDWPAYRLGTRERTGTRGERYTAAFRGPKRTHEFSVRLEQLKALETGQRCTAGITAFGAIPTLPDCSSGYPERR